MAATDTSRRTALTCQELLLQAKSMVGSWEKLADRVQPHPVTGQRQPTKSRIQQMARIDGISQVSDPVTLWGLASACEGLVNDKRFSIKSWVFAQLETPRCRALLYPEQHEGGVTPIASGRSRPQVHATPLESAVRIVLAETDTSGFTARDIGEVVGLIKGIAAGTRHRRGA